MIRYGFEQPFITLDQRRLLHRSLDEFDLKKRLTLEITNPLNRLQKEDYGKVKKIKDNLDNDQVLQGLLYESFRDASQNIGNEFWKNIADALSATSI